MAIRDNTVPALNKDTGRVVWVLPETLKDHPERFQRVPKEQAGDPRYRHKPPPPSKPRRPRPPRDPKLVPDAPVAVRPRVKPVKPVKPVPSVPKVKPVQPALPPTQRKVKKPKRLMQAARVVSRWLDS